MYYTKSIVKFNDAFVITCTISSTPGPPNTIDKSLVPKDLLDSVGQLLDDPLYSDVEFILPSRSARARVPRRIYASKRLLSRADYFNSSRLSSFTLRITSKIIFSVFNAGFVEASSDQFTFEITSDANLDNVDATSEYAALCAHPEDSDEEDEAYDPGEADGDPPNSDVEPEDALDLPHDSLESGISVAAEEPASGDNSGEGEDERARNVKQKVAHPSSPRGGDAQVVPRGATPAMDRDVPGPLKLRVVVKDVAYVTYRAVLYYVLSSSCLVCAP